MYLYILFQCFNELGAKYEVLELDKHPKGDEIQDILQNITGARSVSGVYLKMKVVLHFIIFTVIFFFL